jgi:hypothetical protein
VKSYIDENPSAAKVPAWQITIAVLLSTAYTIALFVALWLSINWLVWVLVALGMGIGIPILLLSCISFAGWIHRKAWAKELKIDDLEIATEGCLWVFFAILEVFFKW